MTNQLADLFGSGVDQVKYNFMKNRDQYIKGVHYLILEGLDFKKFMDENRNPPSLNSLNRAFLWTKSGIFIYAKTLNTEKALERYEDLMYHYFKSQVNEFDIVRKMLDILENTKNKIQNDIDEAKLISNEALQKVKKIEEKIDVSITKHCVKASNIAVRLNLYSRAGLPHVNLITSIAKTLKMKKDYQSYYQNDDIVVISEQIEDNHYWQIYYKPEGAKKIIDWFEENKGNIEFTEFYKKDTLEHKKGDVKNHGYIINKIKYKVQ